MIPVALLARQAVAEVLRDLVRDVGASVRNDLLRVSVQLDVEKLQRLGREGRRAVYTAAARSARPVREAVEVNAQRIARFGFTAKSIGTKTRIYPGGRVVTVIGPKMSFSRVKGKFKKGPRKGQSRRHVPYLYSWLLVKGTKRSRVRDFLGPAWEAEGGNRYLARLREEIARELAALTG